MVLVLALGDLHIPHRAPDRPAKFMSMLAPGKDPAYIVCTGNLCIKEVHDYLKTLCPPTCILPEVNMMKIFTILRPQQQPSVNLSSPWSSDSLVMLQWQLGVDIFVTGHTHSHQFTAYKPQGGVLINPGSAAGAHSSMTYDVNPSSVLMDMDGLHVVVYACELIAREVEVDKINLKKTTATTAR